MKCNIKNKFFMGLEKIPYIAQNTIYQIPYTAQNLGVNNENM